jgi:hypothetical protein
MGIRVDIAHQTISTTALVGSHYPDLMAKSSAGGIHFRSDIDDYGTANIQVRQVEVS